MGAGALSWLPHWQRSEPSASPSRHSECTRSAQRRAPRTEPFTSARQRAPCSSGKLRARSGSSTPRSRSEASVGRARRGKRQREDLRGKACGSTGSGMASSGNMAN